jgi:hypothetical protein
MARFFAAGGFVMPGTVGHYLREALPESYVVVCEPTVAHVPMGAVVVGPAGITVILDPEGNPVASTDPEAAARQAVNGFVWDEFPYLATPVRVLTAVHDTSLDRGVWKAKEGSGMRPEPLAETIADSDLGQPEWSDDATRMEIARTLRDRQLTSTMRTSEPFVFRSGSSLRVGATVWTIRDAVAHMDGHPDDGVYHLRNGTLAAWLDNEGATELARLAREALHKTRGDARASLELFLIGTGLVARPELKLDPDLVDLGYVLGGEKAAAAVRISKGRGRGYLFGELTAGDPWLRVEPRSFAGGPVDAFVTVDTSGLAIGRGSQHSRVNITSSASEAPTFLPVVVRLSAYPSAPVRYLARPAVGALLAGAIGLGIGLLWTAAGIRPPAFFPDSGILATAPWALILALVWGFFGAVRGLAQPRAWPARYASLRWIGRAAGWSLTLGAISALVVWAWQSGLGGNVNIPGLTPLRGFLFGAAFGILPSSLGETAAAQKVERSDLVRGRRSLVRPILGAITGLVMVVALLLAPRYLAPVVSQIDPVAVTAPARGWLAERWQELNVGADQALQKVMLRVYDRRAVDVAPAVTPATPRPVPTATP